MQLIFQNDHVVINLVGVLFGGCYRRSYFELCVCARGQWKVRILRIGEHDNRVRYFQDLSLGRRDSSGRYVIFDHVIVGANFRY